MKVIGNFGAVQYLIQIILVSIVVHTVNCQSIGQKCCYTFLSPRLGCQGLTCPECQTLTGLTSYETYEQCKDEKGGPEPSNFTVAVTNSADLNDKYRTCCFIDIGDGICRAMTCPGCKTGSLIYKAYKTKQKCYKERIEAKQKFETVRERLTVTDQYQTRVSENVRSQYEEPCCYTIFTTKCTELSCPECLTLNDGSPIYMKLDECRKGEEEIKNGTSSIPLTQIDVLRATYNKTQMEFSADPRTKSLDSVTEINISDDFPSDNDIYENEPFDSPSNTLKEESYSQLQELSPPNNLFTPIEFTTKPTPFPPPEYPVDPGVILPEFSDLLDSNEIPEDFPTRLLSAEINQIDSSIQINDTNQTETSVNPLSSQSIVVNAPIPPPAPQPLLFPDDNYELFPDYPEDSDPDLLLTPGSNEINQFFQSEPKSSAVNSTEREGPAEEFKSLEKVEDRELQAQLSLGSTDSPSPNAIDINSSTLNTQGVDDPQENLAELLNLLPTEFTPNLQTDPLDVRQNEPEIIDFDESSIPKSPSPVKSDYELDTVSTPHIKTLSLKPPKSWSEVHPSVFDITGIEIENNNQETVSARILESSQNVVSEKVQQHSKSNAPPPLVNLVPTNVDVVEATVESTTGGIIIPNTSMLSSLGFDGCCWVLHGSRCIPKTCDECMNLTGTNSTWCDSPLPNRNGPIFSAISPVLITKPHVLSLSLPSTSIQKAPNPVAIIQEPNSWIPDTHGSITKVKPIITSGGTLECDGYGYCWCSNSIGEKIEKTIAGPGKKVPKCGISQEDFYTCDRKPKRFSCNDRANRVQPVIRWYRRGARCAYYFFSYCKGEYYQPPFPLKNKKQCETMCLQNIHNLRL